MKNVLCLILMISLIACGGETAQVEDSNKKTETAKNSITKKSNVKQAPIAKQVTKKTTATAASTGDYKAKNEGWLVNLEEAFALSEKTGKPIMANFTGSDWCGWCKRLDRSVFHQPGFADWADKNVVLLELDFPRRFKVPTEIAAQNNSLKQAFRVRGFPSIWVFDAEKDDAGKFNFNALGKTGYTKTLPEFQQVIEGYIAKRDLAS